MPSCSLLLALVARFCGSILETHEEEAVDLFGWGKVVCLRAKNPIITCIKPTNSLSLSTNYKPPYLLSHEHMKFESSSIDGRTTQAQARNQQAAQPATSSLAIRLVMTSPTRLPAKLLLLIFTLIGLEILLFVGNIFSPSFSSELTSAAIETHWLGQDLANEIEKLRQENKDLKEKYANCNSGNDGHNDEAIVKELYDTVSPEKLLQLSTKFNGTYASALPFPHITIDDLFPSSIIQKVIGEHPESILKDGCIPGTERCFDSPEENKKSSINRDERMGTYTRVLFSFLKSSTFTKFLEDLSGIPNLLPDPHFRGSGLHFTATGGSLDIHADFNRHPGNNLDRRVNVFLYLNHDWPEEYGGHLELWSKDMKSCYQRIQPKLGRFVVFSSTDFSCELCIA
jgi:hypothetical protein